MIDALCLLLILVGFGVAHAYVVGCERLKGIRP